MKTKEIQTTQADKKKALDMLNKNYALTDIKRATGLTITEIVNLMKLH